MRRRLLFLALLGPLAALLTCLSRRRVRGLEHLPRRGGALVVCNHISVMDPLLLVDALGRSGRRPRGLATAGLFRAPVLGWVLRTLGFVPVLRGTPRATEALAPATMALQAGEVVMLYPEGGVSRGDQWPMPGKTGAARLALATGVPVVPVAQWGAQRLYPAWTEGGWRRLLVALLTRPRVDVLVGEPLHLTGDPHDPADVRAATEEVMTAVTELLERLRGPRPRLLADAQAA